jgi:putative heme-binding domain-containing protein
VRLALATVLQRLPPTGRSELATALAGRAEDAADHNLPLMIWYGLIPVATADPTALVKVAAGCELPVTRKLVARRLAEEIETAPSALNALLAAAMEKPPGFQADVLAGMTEGLTGWRRASKPAAWDAFAARLAGVMAEGLQERLRDLNVLFGDGRALDEVKATALDAAAEIPARMAALRSLIAARPPELRKICEQLMRTRFLNAVAARGLALFDDPAVGNALAAAYSSFHHSDRGALIDALVSRPSFARALLAHVATGRIPRAAISAYHARQIRSFNDPELTRELGHAWGDLREAAADKQAFIAKLKTELEPAAIARADKSQGRVVYNAVCSACHTLYGQGGSIGPDLTGAGRDNLDYLLENIADPGAVVTADFRMTVVKLKDGRMLNGFIAARTTRTMTIKSATETHTVQRDDIASMEESPQSVMPDGLLETLTPQQRRDLFAYLMHPTQVPLP